MGPRILPYASPIFERTSAVVRKLLHPQQQTVTIHIENLLVASLDLISCLINAVVMGLESHVDQIDVFTLAILGLDHAQDRVRQSACFLAKKMITSCYPVVSHLLPRLTEHLLSVLEQQPGRAEALLIGEIAVQYGQSESTSLFRRFFDVLN